jgi:hypothetical protein
MTYVSEVLADSPLAYWRLGEASGTTAADASGNSRTGTYVNTPTLGVAGLQTNDADTAMSIASNTGQIMSATSAAWMDVSSISVEVFVKFSSATDATNGDAIVSRFNSPNFNWLVWRNTSSQLAFQIRNTSGTVYNVSSSSVVTVGTTYHVVATYNGTSCVLYVDGTQVATTPVTGTVQTGGGNLEIGRYSGTNTTTPGATIDEVAVYGTALTSTRVSTHYGSSASGIPTAQVETNYVEAMASGSTASQVEANYVETMVSGSAMSQVEANYVETLASGTKNAQVEANYIEAMVQVQPAQVSSVYAETALTGTPPTQIESVYLETLLGNIPTVNASSVYLEVLVIPIPGVNFIGWGAPL